MNDDPRCCGSGTCIIDAEGRCWCGQQWNGREMAPPVLAQRDAAGSQGQACTPPVDEDTAAHP